jgi:3D (Asp-Asp-Asp) domain-containing protein
MRIIRIIAILLMLSAVILPQTALASETVNTDTNIKTVFSKITGFFFPAPALADVAPVITENVAAEPAVKEKTQEEIKNEAILANWKGKQTQKWANLPKDQFVINASAYTAAADECDNNKGITSSGIIVKENRTLACPPEFPFGAKIRIEGMGTYTCEDRGGAIKGNHFDIYMETKGEAFHFGRRNLMAQVVE